MANEISRTTRLSWTRDGGQIVFGGTETFSQTVANAAILNVQSIADSETAVLFGDVGDPKFIGFKNMEPKDQLVSAIGISISDSFTNFDDCPIRLDPGESIVFSNNPDITTWSAISESGTRKLMVCAINQ